MIKNDETDLANIKAYLKSVYKLILFGYKYYSSINPIQDIWCV